MKTSNEKYRRRKRRKATKKELSVLVEKDRTNYNLRNARKQWLNKVRYKKIKLAKGEEKRTIHVSARPERILQNAGRRGGT